MRSFPVLVACGLILNAIMSHAARGSCLVAARDGMNPAEVARYWRDRVHVLNSGRPAFNLDLKDVHQTSDPRFVLHARVDKPANVDDEAWRRAYYVAALRPVAHNGPSGVEPPAIGTSISRPPLDAPQHLLTITVNTQPSGFFRQDWELLLLACMGSVEEFNAFAYTKISVIEVRRGVQAGVLSAFCMLALLALATAKTNKRQITYLYRTYRNRGYGKRAARILARARCFSPAFISQDAFGVASLGRFQVLLFTICTIGVYAYAYALTSALPVMSDSVLALLRIALGGSALARVAEGPTLTTANRIWLMGTGAIRRGPRVPSWRDFFADEAELDVTRAQALAFTVFSVIALVVNGTSDLENFSIPGQINYLIGISQGICVAGKALPKESLRRLNEEIQALRNAETALMSVPPEGGATSARNLFVSAKIAASATLADVFGDRFDPLAFDKLQPGGRLPASVFRKTAR